MKTKLEFKNVHGKNWQEVVGKDLKLKENVAEEGTIDLLAIADGKIEETLSEHAQLMWDKTWDKLDVTLQAPLLHFICRNIAEKAPHIMFIGSFREDPDKAKALFDKISEALDKKNDKPSFSRAEFMEVAWNTCDTLEEVFQISLMFSNFEEDQKNPIRQLVRMMGQDDKLQIIK